MVCAFFQLTGVFFVMYHPPFLCFCASVMCRRIQHILELYPDGQGIMFELLQNAGEYCLAVFAPYMVVFSASLSHVLLSLLCVSGLGTYSGIRASNRFALVHARVCWLVTLFLPAWSLLSSGRTVIPHALPKHSLSLHVHSSLLVAHSSRSWPN